jgi:hypothetical protein
MLYLLVVLICYSVYFGVKVSRFGGREGDAGEGPAKAEERAYPGNVVVLPEVRSSIHSPFSTGISCITRLSFRLLLARGS